jgi:predicted TIM-barrel fold metal-dependent hydrolase
MSDSKFRDGFAQIKRFGLSYDAIVYHHQLVGLAEMANAFPDTSVILNHIGWPLAVGPYAQKREDVFRDWRKGIERLSDCPNVTVKLGGLGMPTMGFGWHERPEPPGSAAIAEAAKPYFDWCIEKFGAARCMFESNFPVDKQAYSYTVIWNAFKRYAAGFSASERASLFRDTAVRVYRLAS